MTKETHGQILETDLYKPVYDYLTDRGYTVNSEVKNCDITAVKGRELIVVELKRSLNLSLIIQATQRQRAADLVYIAVPKPEGSIYTAWWKGIHHLLRRLELGMMLISFKGIKSDVEVVLDPVPFDVNKSKQINKRKRQSILKELEGRNGDYNIGGSCRKKLMTAYRENSVFIACCIDKQGPLSPSRLVILGTGKKTQSILSKNFYGWFEKKSRGLYDLSPSGRESLHTYGELAEFYRHRLEKNEINSNK